MRNSLPLAGTRAALRAAPGRAQTTTPPVPARVSPRLLPQGPTTPNSTTAQTPPAAVRPSPSAARPPSGQVVNINTASEADLDSLPQIGPVRAKTIIGGRPYASTQDLLTKHVLSQRIFDKIKNQITVR